MTLLLERQIHKGMGEQRIYGFPNGRGASVVRGPYSYGGTAGLYEMAVIYFVDETPDSFKLDYTTPITDDVIGWLTEEEVQEKLRAIEALPDRVPA